jgi:hypothetical protein
VCEYEELYHEISAGIDKRPPKIGVHRGMDFDLLVAALDKDQVRSQMEQELKHGFFREFRWDWPYYQWVLDKVLAQSAAFGTPRSPAHLPPEFQKFEQVVARAKAKHQREFEDLQDVIVEYDGTLWSGNISM